MRWPLLAPWYRPRVFECADLDQDGNLDIVGIYPYEWSAGKVHQIDIARGSGGLMPASSWFLPADDWVSYHHLGDLDGDGLDDLLLGLSSSSERRVEVRRGLPLGGFDEPFTALDAGFYQPVVADVDGDGIADFVTDSYDGDSGSYSWSVRVHPGAGDGTFGPGISTPIYGPLWESGDFDGDGRLDIVVRGAGNVLAVQRGRSDGTFEQVATLPLPDYPGESVTGDFDGDGLLDIAVLPDRVWIPTAVHLGRGDGSFVAPHDGTLIPAHAGRPLAIDLDGDGADEVVCSVPNGARIALLDSMGGTLDAVQLHEAGFARRSPSPIDANHDGHLDVAVSDRVLLLGLWATFGGGLSLYLGDGSGACKNVS